MVEFFGDEFIIESYKIPWLIWIQLLVMILVIILLFFGFTIFISSDPYPTSSPSPTTSSSDKPTSSRTHRRDKKVVEEHKATRDSGTCGGSTREDNEIREESAMKEPTVFRSFRFPNHPCNYIGLARQALLKCFGLDTRSESSSNRHHDKQE